MLSQKIDTRHGTANQHSFSHGNCLPYTGVPFAMNYFAPQTTDQKGSWWFHPEDRTFQGYRLTHQPSPWMGDFSYLLLTPFNGILSENTLFHAQSSYRPEESSFRPTHLAIRQLRYGISSRLVPSKYGAILAFSSPKEENGLLLTLPGRYQLELKEEQTIIGEIINFSGSEDPDFTLYFALSFDHKVSMDKSKISGENESIPIKLAGSEQTVHLATSFIDSDQALLNLARESEKTVTDFFNDSVQKWEEHLQRIEINHHDDKQVSTFYHNFYRAFLFPQTFYEYDANDQAIHYDTFSKKVRKGKLYTNNGFWDTYKTVYPLYSLIAQEEYRDMLEGFLNSYRETGFLPKWLSPDERNLMPGTLVDAVIADAAVKEIATDLMPEFLEAMEKAATTQSENPNYGRQGTLDYLKYGYVPANYHESVNHTLDYTYSDFCISQVAATLGETDKAAFYRKQALNYRHLFDKETNFMRAKDTQGNFTDNFSSYRWGKDYAEGSAWQTTFGAYQDIGGLIDLMGGTEKFNEKVTELCNQEPNYEVDGYGCEIHEMSEMAALEYGQFAISNQPSFHYPYLFSYIGHPEKGQALIKQVLTLQFDDSITGYPGDEDNGSMAAWYVFNSLGFYPVTPGSGQYVIGMPLFDQVIIHLSNEKTLTIEASPNQSQQLFVDEVKRNGEDYHKLYFTHNELMQGGTIQFHLGIVPHSRKYSVCDLPFSLSNSKEK